MMWEIYHAHLLIRLLLVRNPMEWLSIVPVKKKKNGVIFINYNKLIWNTNCLKMYYLFRYGRCLRKTINGKSRYSSLHSQYSWNIGNKYLKKDYLRDWGGWRIYITYPFPQNLVRLSYFNHYPPPLHILRITVVAYVRNRLGCLHLSQIVSL